MFAQAPFELTPPSPFSPLFLTVGSQGCGLPMLAAGVQCLIALANEIDTHVNSRRIRTLDIGGGLPTNFDSDDVAPTFDEYAAVLRTSCPDLFENTHRRIITEFGRAIICKVGWTASRIEFVKITPDESKKRILIIHAGSDMFVRTCYDPTNFSLRISSHKITKKDELLRDERQDELLRDERQDDDDTSAKLVLTDVAGPLCFGGDKVGRCVMLPSNLQVSDYIVIRDTGANCLSLWSRHCSRSAPQVIGYRMDGTNKDEVALVLLKRKETPEQALSFWG